ncbi:MAG: hypothetical protein QOD55_1332 [Solirubrobacteraceae bacterium]|nr:hypothetical protein [Solirubrobacteraceae bacterium]
MTAGGAPLAPRRRRRWLQGALAAAVVVAIAVLWATRAMESSSAVPCRSALIPAYLPPDGMARLADRPVRGRVVVFNPANGPGAEEQAAYREAVQAVQRSGTRVLGYVHTTYGERPRAEVSADVDRYRTWYGVDGVFLDEAARTASELAYYRALRDDVRAAGEQLLVLNPGVVPARGYFDIADIVVTFEGAYADYAAAERRTPEWLRRLPPGRVAHLVHGATREQARKVVAEDADAGYVYATSGSLPDPWSTLPSDLAEQEALLAACR